MFNLIHADLYKIRKSCVLKILLPITIISAAVMTVMAYLIPLGKIDKSLAGVGFLFSDANAISILGAVAAGVFICGDFENRMMHDAIASGSGRLAIVINKMIVFICTVALLLLPYAAAAGIAMGTGKKFGMQSVAIGFLHLVTVEAGKSFTGAELARLAVIMLCLILIYAAQLSICIPLAFAFQKPVAIVAVYYALNILLPQITANQNSGSALNQFLSFTPFGQKYCFLTLNTEACVLFRAAAVSVMFLAVMVFITYCVFKKAEIK